MSVIKGRFSHNTEPEKYLVIATAFFIHTYILENKLIRYGCRNYHFKRKWCHNQRESVNTWEGLNDQGETLDNLLQC